MAENPRISRGLMLDEKLGRVPAFFIGCENRGVKLRERRDGHDTCGKIFLE